MDRIGTLAVPIIAGLSLVLVASPAGAQQSQEIVVTSKLKAGENFEPIKRIVSIKDINLKTASGARRMEKRVRFAIKTLCEPPTRPAQWQLDDSKACSEAAWTSARPQMDQALRNARGG